MHNTEYDKETPVSKSQRKRDMDALQRLGAELLDFDAAALDRLDLPEDLLDAIKTAKKIHAHGARKRQLQYIGKLMRAIDPEPVRAAVEARRHHQAGNTGEFHLLEELREALISEGDSALATVLEHFPTADRQHIRKLARQARKEREMNHPPRAARRLFRDLRELQENS
jgi:ribosome-associated protein